MKALIEKRNRLMDEMEQLFQTAKMEQRAFTEAESGEFDRMKKEIGQIDNTMKAEGERRALAKTEARAVGDGGEKTEEEQRALDEKAFVDFLRGEERALNVENNGGVIPAHIANRIIEKVKELSPIYSMVTVYNVGGDLVFPVYDETGDTGAVLVEDMQELTESTGKFTTVKLENHIVGVLKLVSKSLMNRTDFDLLSFIVQKVAENLVEFLEKSLLTGKEGKYSGVFNTENLVTAASETAVTADELIDLQMMVPQVYQSAAVWMMNKDTLKALRKLKDNDGNYLLNKDISGGFGWSLLGKPVYVSDNAPKMAKGTTAVVYGDMSGLYLKLAQGMQIQVLNEMYATRHAVGVCGYVEFDSKIVEPQKLAGLKLAGVATQSASGSKAAT